jgi:hypothetical protein
MMIHTVVVMVRCPVTIRELSTGVEMDAATFERLPDIRSRIKCPVCNLGMTGQRARSSLGLKLCQQPRLATPLLSWT